MPESKLTPQKLAGFGRSFSLLFNRATIYESDHPYFEQSIDEFNIIVQEFVKAVSPLVFMMHQEQFFVDEELLDARVNTGKMLSHFKKADIQSISFYDGIDKNELRAFVGVFTSLNKYPDAEIMKKRLDAIGISHFKINHVLFKKVTTDEEIISRQAFEKLTSEIIDDSQLTSKKLFLDMVIEGVMMEEFEKTLTIKNLVENPGEVSKNMIDADLAGFHKSDAEDRRPGLILSHQLQIIDQKVEESLSGGGDGNLSELAAAVLEMKKQLIDDIETQKALGIVYSDEEMILVRANEITDKVIVQLVKDEYKSGEVSTARMAQILRRLVPEVGELKRLLPQIKDALLEEGMPLSEYLNLVQELAMELQSEELTKVLQETAEKMGIDGEDLIQNMKSNPAQAAELIFLAAEIQKGAGDERELTDLLVDYIEQMGSKLTLDIAREKHVEDEQGLHQVMTGVESKIIGRLRNMDIKNDVMDRLEERLNSRIDDVFEKIKDDWVSSQSSMPEKVERNDLSVLQILEQSVSENEELGKILRTIRSNNELEDIDENDFREIFTEISKQKKRKQEQKTKRKSPSGILNSKSLMFVLEKEISRSLRYDLPFAALSFSVVTAKPEKPVPSGTITHQLLTDAILQRLSTIVRDADLAGHLGKNKVVVLLPMTQKKEAKIALRRHLRLLNTAPIEVNGIPLTVKIAGVTIVFEPDYMPDAKTFLETLSTELSEMVARIKNIQELF